MLCNFVNFFSVSQESEVGWGRQWGEEMRKKERSKVGKTPADAEKKCGG